MSKLTRRLLKPYNLVWLGLALVLWWLLQWAPWGKVWDVLKGLRPAELGILVAVNLFIIVLLSGRWWLILRILGFRTPFLPLSAYRLAGFAISYFTPGTQFGGEPLQVYLVEKRCRVPRSAAVASVTLDKLFELLANFTFLSAGVIVLSQSGLFGAGAEDPWVIAWMAGLFCLPLAYLLALWLGRTPLSGLAHRLPARWQSHKWWALIEPLLTDAEAQISRLMRQRPIALLGVALLSGAIWLPMIAEYGLMLWFLGAHASLTQTISAMTAARLAFLTPIPGGLGALEAGQALVMQAFGFGAALGIGASLLVRARDTLVGLVGLIVGALVVGRQPLRRIRIPVPEAMGQFQDRLFALDRSRKIIPALSPVQEIAAEDTGKVASAGSGGRNLV
jgi:uncharacterized protein (TIRG00374 family)